MLTETYFILHPKAFVGNEGFVDKLGAGIAHAGFGTFTNSLQMLNLNVECCLNVVQHTLDFSSIMESCVVSVHMGRSA